MSSAIDAIVLAGNKGGSKHFEGRNKTFLEVAGKPLLTHVIEALDQVGRVSRLVVVGPAARIREIIIGCESHLSNATEILVLEQHQTIYENFWSAFLELLGKDYVPGLESRDKNIEEKPVLLVPGDTPFMCAEEIDEFLDACLHQDIDYGVGMTEERFLRRFYPTESKPGIRMTYLHLSNGSFRLNNLHFARPFRVRNRAYVEQIYESRYQKHLLNMLRVVKDVAFTKGLGLRPVALYGLIQLSVLFHSLNASGCLELTRRRITPEKIRRIACILLKANVAIVETTAGGCAIDVDNAVDYETICQRYDEFLNR